MLADQQRVPRDLQGLGGPLASRVSQLGQQLQQPDREGLAPGPVAAHLVKAEPDELVEGRSCGAKPRNARAEAVTAGAGAPVGPACRSPNPWRSRRSWVVDARREALEGHVSKLAQREGDVIVDQPLLLEDERHLYAAHQLVSPLRATPHPGEHAVCEGEVADHPRLLDEAVAVRCGLDDRFRLERG